MNFKKNFKIFILPLFLISFLTAPVSAAETEKDSRYILLQPTLSGKGVPKEIVSDTLYIRSFTPEEYGLAPQIFTAVQDKRGIMYFGNKNGIIEFDGSFWRIIKLPQESGVYCLTLDPNGRIFIGGEGEFGFLEPDYFGRMTYHSLSDQIPEEYKDYAGAVFQIQFTDNGVAFLSDKLLYLYNENGIRVFETADYFLTSVYINRTLFLIDGARGLLQFKDNTLEPVPGASDYSSLVVIPYQETKLLIFLPNANILIYDLDKSIHGQDAFETLPNYNFPFFKGTDIKQAVVLPNGNIVLGTIKKGCFIIDKTGSLVNHYHNRNALQSNDIYDIYKDWNNNIWLCTGYGMTYVRFPDNDRFMQKSESDSAAVNNGTVDTDELEFSAMIRLVEDIKAELTIFGGAFYNKENNVQTIYQTDKDKYVYSHKVNAFRISYSSNFYKEPEKIEYQTFLEGLDEDWQSWSNRNEREYTSLYWGKYTFRVRARNTRDEISKEATFTFRIKPPWFESWWFYAGQIALLLSMLVVSSFLSQYKQAEKASEKITTIVVIVLFKYLYIVITPVIGIFSSGIAFFKIALSVVLGFIISPAQDFIKKTLDKITKVKKQPEDEPEPEETEEQAAEDISDDKQIR